MGFAAIKLSKWIWTALIGSCEVQAVAVDKDVRLIESAMDLLAVGKGKDQG